MKTRTILSRMFNKNIALDILPEKREVFEEQIRTLADESPDFENLIFEFGLVELTNTLYGAEVEDK